MESKRIWNAKGLIPRTKVPIKNEVSKSGYLYFVMSYKP